MAIPMLQAGRVGEGRHAMPPVRRRRGQIMRVLVVGSGGREHALCWSLSASPLVERLWCAPGNPGTALHAQNVPIGATDIASLVAFAQDNAVDLVVPGPEAPLVAGITDAMEAAEHFLLRPERGGGAARRQQGFCKGSCGRCRHPDRTMGAVRGRGGCARLRAAAGRAGRGQGRRAGGGQGRRGRRDRD